MLAFNLCSWLRSECRRGNWSWGRAAYSKSTRVKHLGSMGLEDGPGLPRLLPFSLDADKQWGVSLPDWLEQTKP